MLARGPEPLARCVKIAGRQHGVLAARQAHAQGVSAVTVQRLVRAGYWKRVRPSVYALWIPTDPAQLWRQRLMAGTLWLGDWSAVSHRAAGVDWELDGVGSAPIELSTTRRHQSSDAALVVHRVRALPAGDIVVRTGLRVTSLPRTLLDLCAVVDPLAVELALESALRRRLTTIEELTDRVRRSAPTKPGRGWLGELLGVVPSASTESALEVLVWRLLRDGGPPTPVRQFKVRDRNGRLVARVDFAYPEPRIAIEADGHRFHSSRRDWERDLARQNALTRLGWITYRVTWEDAIKRGRKVVADVAALLAGREA